MYEHAIALDPNFAPAHAGLGYVCGLFYSWHDHDQSWLEKGRATCERALALEPGLAEALAAAARISWAQHKYDDAIRDARAAIRRKSDCESAYWTLGQALFATDRSDQVVALTARALEVSGDDYNIYIPFFAAAEHLGQTESARQLRQQQNHAIERHLEWVPEDVRARILLAANHAFFQNEADAMRELHKAVALRPNDANILYNSACVYGILRKKTEAMALLKRAIAAGLSKWEWVARDPDLACLQDDPEFHQLIDEGKRKG
jgi:tetratricopeptide (TPR) repeat protein